MIRGRDAVAYVYILRCGDNTFYTGYTVDIEHRLQEHQCGRASKYTRGRIPVELVYLEGVASKSAALKREREIKGLSREAKQQLIEAARHRP